VVIAVVARAAYTADRELLKEFGRVLASGMPERSAHQSIIALRDFLLRDGRPVGRTTGRDKSELEVYQKTARALRAFLMGQAITRLYAIDEELFPVPTGTEESNG
jgi:hypothetical protein